MNYLKIKAITQSKIYYNNELYYILLKYMTYNTNYTNIVREWSYIQLWSLNNLISIVKFRKRCILSNQSRYVLSFFRFVRMHLKKYIYKAKINGIRFSSW